MATILPFKPKSQPTTTEASPPETKAEIISIDKKREESIRNAMVAFKLRSGQIIIGVCLDTEPENFDWNSERSPLGWIVVEYPLGWNIVMQRDTNAKEVSTTNTLEYLPAMLFNSNNYLIFADSNIDYYFVPTTDIVNVYLNMRVPVNAS